MSWSRPEPDPLRERRRQLAEQERLLAQRMSQLTQELQGDTTPPVEGKKAAEPPVWRMEEDAARGPSPDSPPPRPVLARQRQRDMMIFFLCTALLLAIVSLVAWLWKTHLHMPE